MLLRHPRPAGAGAGGGELALPKVLSMALTISDTYVEKSEEEAMEEYWAYKHALYWGPKAIELESGSEDWSEDWPEEASWDSESDADNERDGQQSGAIEGSSIAGREVVAEQEPDTKEPSTETNAKASSAESEGDQDSGRNAVPVSPSSFDYLGHIRHLDMKKWSINMEWIWPEEGKTHYSTTFEQYVKQDKDEQQRRMGIKDWSLRSLYNDLLYQEATWALANPILEQLLSLRFPILDVGRYLGVVSRFRRLEKVLFTVDYLTENSQSLKILPAGDFSDPAGNRLQHLFRTTVVFVKEHARLFPGRLKTATISERLRWGDSFNDGRQEAQFEIFQILPPLHGIKELTGCYWPRFLAHPLTTDVSRLEMISNTPKDRIDLYGQILPRCRSLRGLDTTMPGKGTFKWAVEEKQQMKSVGDNTMAESCYNLGVHLQEISRPDNVQHCLVPLANVHLRENDETVLLTDELDDIAFAFSQTLQVLGVTLTGRTSLPRQIHIGQGWVDLPMLSTLSILCEGGRVVIDGLLQLCPSLVSVNIKDKTREYRCQDVVPCAAANLANVTYLSLTGWSALTFNPATLHSTKRLDHLTVSMVVHRGDVGSGLYIPPVRELNRSYGITDGTVTATASPTLVRPAWTWDWHLPHLWCLALGGESAYMFQFRMVQGCPTLGRLELNIHTEGVTHTRILSSTELYSTSAPSSKNSTAAAATTASSTSLAVRERIVAPQVQSLILRGDWVACDMTLRQFMKSIFPELENYTHVV
ncbi:hypothetical protein BGZ97_011732 [Linnemannia gamsii]|uniref:Uncharacterized protein n=1 Tax=Linnemannia gamsii TaxID=64522 RepID=A0A9P6R5G2_9FUNG|nr:hypothetical protein BGZ97_011732 [Linnemannia gamsii]